MEQQKTRRFSLDEDFMNYGTNDLLYGFMRCLSTARPATKEELEERPNCSQTEYLLQSTFIKDKKTIAGICGCSTQTINNRLKRLIDCGLVEEGVHEVERNGKLYQYKCYYFPFDYNGNYKTLNKEMVQYLVFTRNAHAIRIYLYLLNCSTMKKDYMFTIKEISKALGYADTTQTAEKAIRCVLTSFKKEGVIKFENIYDSLYNDVNGTVTQTPKMVLKFVATNPNQF